MVRRESFLTRWSRRKAEAPAEVQAQTVPEETDAVDEMVEPPALPDIDSLDRYSDFSAFLQPGVGEALGKQALRKLWRLDPAFSELDGLVEYGEDYAAKGVAGATIRTAWRAGRGIAGAFCEDETGQGDDEAAQEADVVENDEASRPKPQGTGRA